jgi:hypothetical protein
VRYLIATALIVIAMFPASQFCQNAERLRSVKRVFIGSFGEKPGASALRDSVAAMLEKSRGITVVKTPAEADAAVFGTGEVWIKGHFSLNPRQRQVNADSQPIYGGYLSVELKGKGDETLWSYLATPQRDVRGDIHKELAGRVVKKLLAAVAEERK